MFLALYSSQVHYHSFLYYPRYEKVQSYGHPFLDLLSHDRKQKYQIFFSDFTSCLQVGFYWLFIAQFPCQCDRFSMNEEESKHSKTVIIGQFFLIFWVEHYIIPLPLQR